MLQSRVPSQESHDPAGDISPLASLSRTLQALEERLARLPRRAEPKASVPMIDPAPTVDAAPAEVTPIYRKMVLGTAVSEIVMRRQMLDRDVASERSLASSTRSDEPRRLHPRAILAEAFRDEQIKTLAVGAETLQEEGKGFSAMSEVAAELQRLREEIRRDSMPKMDPRFEEMRAAFDELRDMIASQESHDRVGAELARIADGLAQLTEDGADRSTLNTLRAEFEEMRGLFARMAHETSLKAESEIEVKRDIKDELQRLRESLRSLASEDQIKAVEKRWNEFEQRYVQSPSAPDESTISRLLQTELESVRGQIEALSGQSPMDAVEKRWDALEERLDTRQMEDSIQRLSERLGDIEGQLAKLPSNLAISALDARVRTLSESVDTLASQAAAGPDIEQFVLIEDRLDEISRAIVATSLQQPAIDMAPIERIEARIATLTARIDADASRDETGLLAERVAELGRKLDLVSSDPFPAEVAERMAALSERFETAFHELEAPRLDTSAIEARLSALTSRLEETATPQIDTSVVQALEAQIARLAQSLDRPGEIASAELDLEIERRLEAIEQRLDDQRDALIAAAREIADDTARRMEAAGDRRQGEHVAQLSANLKTLESLSRENDERAGQVFESLHGTLMKIVDRLEQIELDVGARTGGEPAPAEAKAPVKALVPAVAKPAAADAAAPSFLRGGEVVVAEKPAARGTVSAPSLDAADMLDSKEANRPLEPGSGAPDIGALLERLQLQRGGKGASNREPMGDAELVAAARRASRAAAAAVETEAKAASATAGKSDAGRLSSFVQRRRKPILVAVLAVIAALAALPLKDELGPVLSAKFGPMLTATFVGGKTIEGTTNPVAPAAVAEAVVEQPSAATTGSVTPAPAQTAPASETVAASPVTAPSVSAATAPQTAEAAAAAPAANDEAMPARRSVTTTDLPAIMARAEAKLPAGSIGAVPAVPETVGSPALVTAAKGGDAKALFEVGLRLMEGRGGEPKPAEALTWFAQAAKRGFAPAQYSLGTLFEKGNGIARDTGAARDWYLLAANQGNVRAMHNLAVLYATGVEGVSDPDTALSWFEKAADLGMRDSQYNLGILYARGSGTDQDLASSYKWFSIVAKSGDKDAEAKMQEIAKSMAPDQLQRAQALVSGWAPKQRPESANTVEVPAAWADKPDTTASVDMKRAVQNIQAILAKLGYDAGTPDGVIGQKTKTAILAFQKKAGLQVTGSIDEPLIRALLERKDG